MTNENTTNTDIGTAGAGHSAPVDNGGMPEGVTGNMENRQYVGFWARVGAYLIDLPLFLIPLIIPWAVVYVILFPGEAEEPGMLSDLLFFIYAIVVCAAVWRRWGATPGKAIIGAKIVDEATGESPSMKQCLIRSVCYIAELFTGGLLFAVVAFSKKKQGIHDMVAKTVVVKRK